MLVGYGRTSTAEQQAELEDQDRNLRAAGCKCVFTEQISSVSNRTILKFALSFVRGGDVLVATKADRLAQNTTELLIILADLKSRGVNLLILSMGGLTLDTRKPASELMLVVLGSVAAFELAMVKERQAERIVTAKAEQHLKGRTPTAKRQTGEVIRLKGNGVTSTEIAKRLGISRMSVYRVLKSQTKKGQAA